MTTNWMTETAALRKASNPIGNNSSPFRGVFDGKRYVITGLYINRPNSDYVALFGVAINAMIKNVGVVNAGGRP